MARISKIQVFPIKSFDGVAVEEAQLRPNGSLRHDREFKFITADGMPVDSLDRDNSLYRIRAADADWRTAHFSMPDHPNAPAPATFDLHEEADAAGAWMSNALGKPVTLVRDDMHGFADDHEFAGPTIIGQGTLDSVARASGHPDVPRRLRANITIDGIKPFAEDNLARAERFTLGDAAFAKASPCVRCNVLKRDPTTGIKDRNFHKKLIAERLRVGMCNPSGQTDYIASVNTMAAGEQAGRIAVGDILHVVEKSAANVITHAL